MNVIVLKEALRQVSSRKLTPPLTDAQILALIHSTCTVSNDDAKMKPDFKDRYMEFFKQTNITGYEPDITP